MSSKTKRRAKIVSDSDDMGSSDIEQVGLWRRLSRWTPSQKPWDGAKKLACCKNDWWYHGSWHVDRCKGWYLSSILSIIQDTYQ